MKTSNPLLEPAWCLNRSEDKLELRHRLCTKPSPVKLPLLMPQNLTKTGLSALTTVPIWPQRPSCPRQTCQPRPKTHHPYPPPPPPWPWPVLPPPLKIFDLFGRPADEVQHLGQLVARQPHAAAVGCPLPLGLAHLGEEEDERRPRAAPRPSSSLPSCREQARG